MIGLQVQDRDPYRGGVALQLLQETQSESQASGMGSDPHALDLCWGIRVQLQGATAHRLLSQLGKEQQSGRGHELVVIRLDAASGIEASTEALVQLSKILLDAPAGIGAGWIGNADRYQRSNEQALDLRHRRRELETLAFAEG